MGINFEKDLAIFFKQDKKSLNPVVSKQPTQLIVELNSSLRHIIITYNTIHYHLEVQANPKKMAQKTDAIFSIYGRNGVK